MIRFSYEQKPPRHRRYLWSLALFVAIPAVVIVGVLAASVQRIHEIGKGEEEDARKY